MSLQRDAKNKVLKWVCNHLLYKVIHFLCLLVFSFSLTTLYLLFLHSFICLNFLGGSFFLSFILFFFPCYFFFFCSLIFVHPFIITFDISFLPAFESVYRRLTTRRTSLLCEPTVSLMSRHKSANLVSGLGAPPPDGGPFFKLKAFICHYSAQILRVRCRFRLMTDNSNFPLMLLRLSAITLRVASLICMMETGEIRMNEKLNSEHF